MRQNRIFFTFLFLSWVTLAASSFAQEGIIETLKFKDADIRVVLQAITQKANHEGTRVNILIAPDVKGVITVDLENVDWQTALDAVLKTYDYGYEWTGKNIILVDTLENLSKKRKKVVEAQVVEPLDTRVFSLSFAKVEDAVKTVKEVVSARGKVIADSRTNNLIVTDTHANLAVIQGAIKAIDMITPQVLIQAKIIETDLATTQKLGIDWTIGAGVSGATHPTYWPFRRTSGNKYQPTYYTTATDGTILEHNAFPDFPSANFGVGTLNASALAATLEVLLNDSNTSIKSMPSITTLDNNTAGIKVVTKDPLPNYTYNSQTGQWEINGYTQLEYGVSLEVTPQINKEGFVTLVVKPNVSEVTGQRTFSSGGSGASVQIPILDEQTTVTKVMVRDGETLVIGGLIRDKVEEIVKKVPILGSIPVLDFFFKHKSKSVVKKNLLIFITPTIVTPSRGDSSAAPEAAAAAQEKAVAKVPVQVQATAQVPAKGQ